MAALCRQHGVTLTVVTSPLNRLNARDYDPAELARVTERIARVVPLWDFGTPDWLSDRGDLWADPSHFKPEVGRDDARARVRWWITSGRLRHAARRLKLRKPRMAAQRRGCVAAAVSEFPPCIFAMLGSPLRQVVTVI